MPEYVLIFRLQWDRTREGAEVRTATLTGIKDDMLQWDRTREGAEVSPFPTA